MASTITDRIDGVTASLAVKTPVRAATTVAIALEGEQTIDGVSVTAGDRVLVKDQASPAENGIYSANTGTWSRARDFDGSRDVLTGTLVLVTDGGATNGGTAWEVTTGNPITIGTSGLGFVRSLAADLPTAANPGDDGKVLTASGGSAVWTTLASLLSTAGAAILNAANVFTGAVTFRSSDAGPADGPVVTLDRNSASPADNDSLGEFIFSGRHSAAATIQYAQVRVNANDVDAGTEDAQFQVKLYRAGALTNVFDIADGVRVGVGAAFMGLGTINAQSGIYKGGTELDDLYSSGPVTGTPQATTSGSSKTFGSIPAGTTRITVLIDTVQLSGTDDVLIQIGTSSGIETTGYNSTGTFGNTGGVAVTTSVAGFIVPADNSGAVVSGTVLIHHIGSNRWLASVSGRVASANGFLGGGGEKTLVAELSQLLIKPSGANTFTAGQVNIIYE